MDRIGAWFKDHAAWLEGHTATAVTALITLVLVIVAAMVISVLRRLVQKWLRRFEARLGLPYETPGTVARVVTGAVWVITAMIVLEMWGISVGGVWTLLVGAATIVGVGFLATWAMVSNITASLFLVVWRPFNLGDTVEILPENLKGRVIDRNLMFIVLREDGGATLRVPNNLFFQKMFRVSAGADGSE